MHFRELPESMRVSTALASSPQSIIDALVAVLDGEPMRFTYWCPAMGHIASVRYFAQEKLAQGMVPMRATTTREIGYELHRLANQEARFPPRTKAGGLKGWEFRRGMVGGKLVAIVIATWV